MVKRMVKRMAGPQGMSANALAGEVGVSQATLSRWLEAARTVGGMSTTKSGKWVPADKLRVINQASHISDDDLGTFLRKQGVHEATLREWQDAATLGLSTPKRPARGKKSPEAKRIIERQGDLRRKEKAMAEMVAIITLQKKVREIWGGAADDTTGGNDA